MSGPNPAPELDWTRKLVVSLSHIREPKQRVAKLIGHLREHSPSEAVDFLEQVFGSPKKRFHPLQSIHLDLLRFHQELQKLGYEMVAAMYEEASRRKLDALTLMLRTTISTQMEEESIPEGFVVRLRNLTLGQRKQLSRTIHRRHLEALLFDSDPAVIEHLLLNPRITERDVIRMASRHQAPAAVIETICLSDRWMKSYRVRKAVVFNPQTPLPLAAGFLEHLRIQDLKLLLTGGSTNRGLVERARTVLQERGDEN